MTEGPTGLLVVDKPGGMTSHDVVARVRRAMGTRKVGHAGTLDPMATGVLLLGVGRATRLLGHLTLTAKAYDARARLGSATTTDDAEGEPTSTADPHALAALDPEAVRAALAGFVGEIDQVPSSVSAVKIEGRRAYQRVRDGEVVELPARRVSIASLEVTGLALPEVAFSLDCSSGTYVRAVARDLGEALGVGGHLVALRRTRVGPFTLDDALPGDGLTPEAAGEALLPIADVARRSFPALDLDDAEATAVRHGRRVDRPTSGPTALFDPAGEFLALYGPSSEPGSGSSRAVAVFV